VPAPASGWCGQRIGIYEWVPAMPVRNVAGLSPEAELTPLGLTPPELAHALGRYRLSLHALLAELDGPGPVNLHNGAYSALEEFGTTVDVDLSARSAPCGDARMSEVERRVLMPLLMRLHARIARVARGAPPVAWLGELQAADADVAASETALSCP
jgi:hypothetical protein